MKRKLALFLVLALVLSLVPANVFAATSNSVNTVPTVADDTNFVDSDAPILRVQEANDNEFGTSSQTFVLKLENAEWSNDATDNATGTTYTGTDAAVIDAYATANQGDFGPAALTVQYLSATRMQVTIVPGTHANDGYVKIPLVAELQGEGAAKVTIESKNSSVTSGTYTFANGSGGNTDASIDDTTTFRDTATMENIVIEELVTGTVGTGSEINLKITNSDFDWETTATITFTGAFAPWGTINVTNAGSANPTAGNYYVNGNVLTFVTPAASASTGLGTITIAGLQIDPSSDANFGDVSVKVYGDEVTDETLLVGKYVDYTLSVEADDTDLPTIYAGDLADGYTEDVIENLTLNSVANALQGSSVNDYELVDQSSALAGYLLGSIDSVDGEENEIMQLNIEEEVAKSWIISRETKITFPDNVKIIDFDVEKATNISTGNDTTAEGISAVETALQTGFETGDNELSFDGLYAADGDSVMKLHLQFYVSVEADSADGDIVATVGGKAIGDEFKVKLATVKAPVTAAIEVKDVKIGVQDQVAGKIAITEAAEGVIADNEAVVVTLDSEDGLKWSATPEAKVTKGDIEIDEVEKNTTAGTITTTIDSESSEASTFELTGFEVDVNRTVPEGDFNVTIGGLGIVKNYEDDADYYFFDTDSVVDTKYVRVITPAPGDTTAGEKVVFTIGSADYMVGAVKMTADAAPYINEQGRTMLPLRALANALGVTDANIMWNEVERSVTIFKGDATIKVVIGQMSFVKNGVSIPMDTTAVIVNGRTMLPLRAIGQALGAEVLWDEATRTVTVQ